MTAPRKFQTYAAAIALVLAIIGTAHAKYSGGTGEPNDPYQIATAQDLIALGETPGDYDKHFILTADIDLSPNLPGRKVFDRAVIAPVTLISEPSRLSVVGAPFTGVFDGDHHAISRLTISGGDCAGLFGCLEFRAKVKNLGVVKASITTKGFFVGSLLGCNFGKVTNCYSTGTVSGVGHVGGLVGVNYSGSLTACCSASTVSGGDNVGGLAGHNGTQYRYDRPAGSITQCYSTGRVSGSGWGTGGLVGASDAALTQSYSTASVSGGSVVGGLVGCNYTSVTECYSAGAVSARDNVGGMVGLLGTAVACFWDTQTSGQGTSAGGTGKTTADMRRRLTFAAWDFQTTWSILEGLDYPRLRWEPDAIYADAVATTLEKVSGDNQQGMIGSKLPSPLVVRLRDQYGQTMVGVQVAFTIMAGAGTVEPAAAVTNASGIASATVTLGSTPGPVQVRAAVGSLSVDFSIEALALPVATTLEKVSGDNQQGMIGSKLPSSLAVRVRDQYEQTMAGVQVAFTVMAGAGTVEPAAAVTNASGIASATVTLGSTPGPVQVRAAVGSLSVDFSIEALALPVATTLEKVSGDNQQGMIGSKLPSPLVVRLKDQYGETIADAQVVFSVLAEAGTVEPALAVTNASGIASASVTLGSTPGPVQVQAAVGGLSVDFSLVARSSPYSAGSGEPNDPYQIATAADLIALGETPGDYHKHFVLVADIDLDPNLPGRKVFDKAIIAPDTDPDDELSAFQGTRFAGVFDGNGHTVSNLTINGGGYLGLFGYVASRALVRNLGMMDVATSGSGAGVGGLVGENHGQVIQCCTAGTVSGRGQVGGLVGRNAGTVTQCYSTAAVHANSAWGAMGGLVGQNSNGVINECYSAGRVSGETWWYFGGLVGWGDGAAINSFWDIQTSGQTNSAGGKGRSTEQMKCASTYRGWTTCGQAAWTIEDGQDYPRLAWEGRPGVVLPALSLGDSLSGKGTQAEPYLIESADQFNLIGLYPCEWDKCFRLMADIELSGYPAGEHNVIGVNYQAAFQGIFDGNGHTLSDLTITGTGHLGVFGHLADKAEVRNLGVVNVNITSRNSHNGSLVGQNRGIVTNCYSAGSINCYSADPIGLGAGGIAGLVGENTGTVTQCYSTGVVSGRGSLAGLVGYNSGVVTYCYSAVRISGTGESTVLGGLVGSGEAAINSFWDIQTSGQTTSAGGHGRSTEQMQRASTYRGWNTCGQAAWTIEDGQDYPRLAWEGRPGVVIPAVNLEDSLSGKGTQAEPYLIESAEQFNLIGLYPCEWDKCFRLMADIDLSGYPTGEYNVIGVNSQAAFQGIFDGNGHALLHLRIKGTTHLGVFGYLARKAEVKNLGVVNVKITGSSDYCDWVGGLVGDNLGAVTECYSTGSISVVGDKVGGLVGYNRGAVTRCYSTGAVSGRGEVGGLVGYNVYGGAVTNCYSRTVTKAKGWYVGGLIGLNSGRLLYCYSTGQATGFRYVGGLVGSGSWATSCFWDTQTSKLSWSDGGEGKKTAEMQLASTFVEWGMCGNEGVWVIDEGHDWPRLAWEHTPGQVLQTLLSDFLGGTGTKEDPYLIYTTNDLDTIARFPCEKGKHFRLAFLTGEGTEQAPYLIETSDQIALLRQCPYEQNGRFRLAFLTGEGTEQKPYLIETAGGLDLFGMCPRERDACFRLTADIDLSGYDGRAGRPAFNVMASFAGVFDGGGHTISHLTINGGGSTGVFEGLAAEAKVANLGVVDVNVTGQLVGALAGWNSGELWNCHSTGVVNGAYAVGGLVGTNAGGTIAACTSTATVSGAGLVGGLLGTNNAGTVSQCYSSGVVSAVGDGAGGLVGSNGGTVIDCYACGVVHGLSSVGGLVGTNCGSNDEEYAVRGCVVSSYSTAVVRGEAGVGGLVGTNDFQMFSLHCVGAVVGCLWDVQTSGQATSAAGTGKTTAEMQDVQTYLEAQWDWVGEVRNGTHEVWQMPAAGGYPVLAALNGYTPPQLQGQGTPDDPYLITDAVELGAMIHYPAGFCYRLAASIDLSAIHWGKAVIPHFRGAFDGNHLIISHLTIEGGNDLGLFGQLESGAQVMSLGVVDANVAASGDCVGALAGSNVGGFVAECYSTGTIRGNNDVGGFVGRNQGSVADCYCTSVVNGQEVVGGLVGLNSGSVTNCYSIGRVSGSEGLVGGLVGSGWGATANGFWDTQTSGQSTGAGGTGKTTAEMQTASTFLDAGWDFVGETANGTEDIWWILEGKDYPRLWWELPVDDAGLAEPQE